MTWADPRRILRNALMDLRCGGRFLAGGRKTRYAETGAEDTANSDYAELPILFGGLVRDCDVIVDVGCGKGRIFNWLLIQGYRNKMVGVELDSQVADWCRHRLRRFSNVRIITGSILDNIPDDGTLFYLFNPFKEVIMRPFAQALKRSFERNKRDITLIYNNCCLVSVFEEDPCWSVLYVDGPLRHPAAVVRFNGEVTQEGGRLTAERGAL